MGKIPGAAGACRGRSRVVTDRQDPGGPAILPCMEPTTDTGALETGETGTPVSGKPVVWMRPKDGRRAAGVAAGIADQLGVPRWLVRLGFILLTFWNGAGILLYVAGWLLMPGEGETQSLGSRWAKQLSGSRSWVGLVLVVVAVAALIEAFPFFDGGLIVATALLVVGVLLYRGDIPGDFWQPKSSKNEKANEPTSEKDSNANMTTSTTTPDPSGTTMQLTPVAVRKPPQPPSPLGQITLGAAIASCGILAVIDRTSVLVDAAPRHYLALILAVVGAGLLVGSLFGRARWLIVLGIFMIPATLGTAVFEFADGRIGQVDELARPVSFAALGTHYDKGAGQLVIDLTRLPWNGESVELTAEVGAGELVLLLPEGVGLEGRGDVGIGEIQSPLGAHGGLSVEETITLTGERGTVIADLSVGVGAIRIEGGDRLPRLDGELNLDPGIAVEGDLMVDLSDAASLEPTYSTSAGDIVLDLSDIGLEEDTSVDVLSDQGDITVILPTGASYRIEARTEFGVIDLFGEERVESGGSIQTDSITNDNFTISFSIISVEGDITLVQGGRS